MKVHVFTQAIKIGLDDGGAVGFRVVAEALPLTVVSLSRNHGGCLFNIDRLWEHDGHAPIFSNTFKRAVYIKRVVDEVHCRLGQELLHPWYKTDYTCLTTEDGKTWETTAELDINPSLKINAPPQAFHGEPSTWENEVKQGPVPVIDPPFIGIDPELDAPPVPPPPPPPVMSKDLKELFDGWDKGSEIEDDIQSEYKGEPMYNEEPNT